MRVFRSMAFVVGVAALFSFAAGPVSAGGYDPDGDVDGADFLLWRWHAPGVRGLGMIQDGASNTIVLAEIMNLQPNSTYRIVASEERCRNQHTSADTEFFIRVDTGNMRDQFTNTTFDDQAVSMAKIKSLRLFMGSTQLECGTALAYNAATDPNPNDSLTLSAFLGGNGVFGMIMIDLGTGDDTLALALHGLMPQTDHRLLGTTNKCANPVTNASRVFRYDFMSSGRGSAYRSAIIENASHPSYVRVFEVGARQVACTKSMHLVPAVQA